MLSKISLVINLILVFAVIYLFTIVSQSKAVERDAETEASPTLKIGYINTDSLNAQYDYVKDLADQLNAELEKKQRRLERKTSKLQSEFVQLQRLSGTMTPAQLQNAQERVVEMEREIQTMQNDLAEEMSEEQMAMQRILVSHLDSFLLAFNASQHYDFILRKFEGSEMLFATPALDLTDTVLVLLNESYHAGSKETKTP
jgi:outer membrane protein